MANLITNSNTWSGKEMLDGFITPLFIGQNPLQQGFRVIPNVQSSLKLNYFNAFNKIVKAYAKGFTGSNFTDVSQRTLQVHDLKAEAGQDAYAFTQTVFEQALNTGVDWNKIDGTMLEPIIMGLFNDAIEADLFRQAWLGTTDKETLTSTTYGNYSGTADADYNVYDGFWKMIFENA